jgi:Short C-terminal domain
MGLLAGMAANRMQTRQSYRTMARMQRRRTWAQDRMGMRQDFQPAGEEQYAEPAPAAPAEPAQPAYIAELEQLAQLRDQGVISSEDFEAKKKELLGL